MLSGTSSAYLALPCQLQIFISGFTLAALNFRFYVGSSIYLARQSTLQESYFRLYLAGYKSAAKLRHLYNLRALFLVLFVASSKYMAMAIPRHLYFSRSILSYPNLLLAASRQI